MANQIGYREIVSSPLLACNPDPWMIPSDEEVAEMEKHIRVRSDFDGLMETLRREFWKLIKWRFSAASAAICFLQSIPIETRLQTRNILLSENCSSITFPESHALGLI